MTDQALVLEIEGTPYSIETNLNNFSWADLHDREKCKNIYATIWKTKQGKRAEWQMEFKGATAITDAVISINTVVGEPVAHRIRKVGG